MNFPKIYTKIITDRDGNVLKSEYHLWGGKVDLCKGDSVAKQQEQQQLQFNTQLMGIFQQQFTKQSAVLDYLKGKLQPIIDAGGTGYSKEALTAMRTGATDQLSTAYQNAQRTLNNTENARNGGSDLPSGVNAQLDAALLHSEATDKAGAQNTITLNNENLKQSNYWNAMNVLSGNVSQQFNPLGYAGAYNQGSGNVAGLSQAVTASQQSGLMGALGGIAGGVFAGAGQAGGFGKLFCWVAASFYGWNSPKTKLIRLWMLAKAPKWFARFYIKHGEAIAKTPLRWAFRPVFGAVLRVY